MTKVSSTISKFMRQKKFIIGKEAAQDWIRKNESWEGARTAILEHLENAFSSPYDERRLDAWKAVLTVPGFCDVVVVYEFYWDDCLDISEWHRKNVCPPHWVYNDTTIAVRILESGLLLRPYPAAHNTGKYGLTLVDCAEGRLQDFHYPEPHPNYIGKVTRKKIEEWADWNVGRKTLAVEFIDNAMKHNQLFKKAVEERFPNADMSVAPTDGWLCECKFCFEGIEYTYTARSNGSFARDYKMDYRAIRPTEDMLGIDEGRL